MSKILTSIFILILMSGCQLKEPLPPVTKYNLSLVEVQKRKNTTQEIIKVSLPISDKSIMSNNIFYDEGNSTLESYVFAKWVDTPNSMIQKILKEAISDSNLFGGVILDYSNLRATLELESNIIELKQIIENNNSFVLIKLRFFLINLKNKSLISSKELEYKVKVNEINVNSAVKSFNLAINHLVQDLILWLYTKS